jgi:glycosyltransferase involved in cell wall biosynthesis
MTRLAVVWPKPRRHRWRAGETSPDTSPDMSDALRFLEDEGIDVTVEESIGLPLNPFAKQHEFYSGLDPVRAARVAARYRRYDAVICIGDATALVLMWLREKLRFELPIVLIDPALSYDYPRRRRVQDFVLPRASRVIVFGRSQIDYLKREYGSAVNATFMHHRADTSFYAPGRARVGPTVTPYVFSVGNDYSRDFETLAAAARICAAAPDFAHRIVVQTVRKIADPAALDVRRDSVSYPTLRALYEGANVVVLPLRDMIHAGGINTLLEAMAMACPIVISASRGLSDYVVDGQTAVTVPVGDAAAMAAAIQRLARRRDEARTFGEHARRFVVEHCDNRQYAKILADILAEVIAEARH